MCGNRMLGIYLMGFCGQSELLLSVFLYDHLLFLIYNVPCRQKPWKGVGMKYMINIPNANADRAKEWVGVDGY